MLKILESVEIIASGAIWEGTPALFVKVAEGGKERDLNSVFEQILSSLLKVVILQGKIMEFPELRTLIQGLSQKGKTVLLITNADDSIDTVRMVKNFHIVMELTPPTNQDNTVNVVNLGLLLEGDLLIIPISSFQDYEEAKKYLLTKVITKPRVYFRLNAELDLEVETKIKEQYLVDTKKILKFKNFLINEKK